MMLIHTPYSFISIYLVLLLIRVLLTWFPNVNWSSQPFAGLSQITDPYLNLFRSVLPPMGGIDFSPMLGFLVLTFIQRALAAAVPSFTAGVF
jgi:Predicted integral membrane protein